MKSSIALKLICQKAAEQAGTAALLGPSLDPKPVSRTIEGRWQASAELAHCIGRDTSEVYSAFLSAAALVSARQTAVLAAFNANLEGDNLSSMRERGQQALEDLRSALAPAIATGLRHDM